MHISFLSPSLLSTLSVHWKFPLLSYVEKFFPLVSNFSFQIMPLLYLSQVESLVTSPLNKQKLLWKTLSNSNTLTQLWHGPSVAERIPTTAHRVQRHKFWSCGVSVICSTNLWVPDESHLSFVLPPPQLLPQNRWYGQAPTRTLGLFRRTLPGTLLISRLQNLGCQRSTSR